MQVFIIIQPSLTTSANPILTYIIFLALTKLARTPISGSVIRGMLAQTVHLRKLIAPTF